MKDLETGLYYNKRWLKPDPKSPHNQKSSYTHWNEFGDIWNNRGSAERMVTTLTKTFKHQRDTETKIILYGSKETARYRVVEATVQDKE